jgi:S1-C subfamily serine protease
VTRAQRAAAVLQAPPSQQRTVHYLNEALAANLVYSQRVATAARSLSTAKASAAVDAASTVSSAYNTLAAATVADDVPSDALFADQQLTALAASQAKLDAARAKKRSFADLVDLVRSGVVRINVDGCDGGGTGTGFLIGPMLVATVAHVVDGASSITLTRNGDYLTSATVVGSDSARDLALLRTAEPISGYRFTLASRPPRIGEQVAALGFPLGLPLTFTRGSISGLDRTEDIEGTTRHSLVQTDTALNPGNSGGPLMTQNGVVVGLVDAGFTEASGVSFAVSTAIASPLLTAWKTSPQPQPLAYCGSDPGPTPPQSTDPPPPSTATNTVAATVQQHWELINEGDYADAYALYSPQLQAKAGRGAWIADKLRDQPQSSELQVQDVTFSSPTTATLSLSFRTNGQETSSTNTGCNDWNGYYNMTELDDSWYIDGSHLNRTPC